MAVSAAKKLTQARANLVMMHPFFGALALRLKMVEDPKVKTGCCDGKTISYNPEFIEKISYEQVQGFLAHEVMHAAFLHPLRRGERDPKKWNKACDYAINPILTDAGFKLPENTCNSSTYRGMSAEHIFSQLPDEPEDNNSDDNQDPGANGGVSDSPESGSSGASPSQQAAEEADWKMAVAQAAHVAKQAGKLPGDLNRLLEELFVSQLPWKNILRRFMTEKCLDNFSWARGNRRFIGTGLYLPSRISDDAMGEVVVCIDTSGSIGQKELNEFGNEIKGIIDETKPSKTYVVYCDSHIAHIDEFGPNDDLQFAAHGGGGTDFRPPFNWIAENQIQPRAVIYLTDGYGPFPEVEPPYPVMWCINNNNVSPPHGEHLILEV